jgi:succinyl-diaminopimelate desuccinylase
MNDATLDLAMQLIARPSVTPDDQGCQQLIAARLAAIGFQVQHLRFGEVDNLWAWRGEQAPLFCFAGHTDVVPPGPRESWLSDPFAPEIREGLLYGRGAADMKGSIAAMVTACERLLQGQPEPSGSIALLITSDEEGPAADGTVRVVEHLRKLGRKLDFCLVGEPSSQQRLGDQIKNGRRGSLNGRLRIFGKQGHVAYPHLASNPLHRSLGALQQLCAESWDQGNAFFPATSFQMVDLHTGSGAENVIPGHLDAGFNFRFSTEVTDTLLRQRVQEILDRHGLNYDLTWRLSGQPFLTAAGDLVSACQAAVREITGYSAELSTSGGTSDGRFIAPTGAEVVELGPLNATIHQANECVAVADLARLSDIYLAVMKRLLRC